MTALRCNGSPVATLRTTVVAQRQASAGAHDGVMGKLSPRALHALVWPRLSNGQQSQSATTTGQGQWLRDSDAPTTPQCGLHRANRLETHGSKPATRRLSVRVPKLLHYRKVQIECSVLSASSAIAVSAATQA